jgi:dihydrofolate synthase/folylpolyglutamate synthase
MGDPQKLYRVVHITGTNGKTSTTRMIERILREMGLRTGRFTSPHLVRLNERMALDGNPVSDERLFEVWTDIAPVLEIVDAELEAAGDTKLTFFEALAVLGFAVFADAPVDVLVLEVGMGGEWDSTNVADGDVAVFTPIRLIMRSASVTPLAKSR